MKWELLKAEMLDRVEKGSEDTRGSMKKALENFFEKIEHHAHHTQVNANYNLH